MRARVPVVLLCRVRVRVNDGVFTEHLAVLLVFGQTPKVRNLVLDLGLDSLEAAIQFLARQPALTSMVVGKPRLRLVFGDQVASVRLRAGLVLKRIVASLVLLSESRVLNLL